jgi:osmotically-inducible protein OsmY
MHTWRKRMDRHYRSILPLLAACAVAVTASAQPPPSAPAEGARERPDVSDAQLGLEVQARLYQQLDVSNLSALVRYGVATLDGTVRSEADRRRAEDIAREVRGVDSVVNELTVAEPLLAALTDEANEITQREKADLEIRITQALRSDAALGSRSIRVLANELTNTVTLTGTVSTSEEKERAGRLAVSAFPAGQVRNQIAVEPRE